MVSIAAAASVNHPTSWVAMFHPYRHAQAGEFAPTVSVPLERVAVVVEHVPYGVLPDVGQSPITVPWCLLPGSAVLT